MDVVDLRNKYIADAANLPDKAAALDMVEDVYPYS